jgi:hypothetical protein
MFFPFSNLDKNTTADNVLYPNGGIYASVVKDNILYLGGSFNSLCEVYPGYAILDTGLNVYPPEIDVRIAGDRNNIGAVDTTIDQYGNRYLVGTYSSMNNLIQMPFPNGTIGPSPANNLGGKQGFVQITPSGLNTGLGASLGGGNNVRNIQNIGSGIFFIHNGNNLNMFTGNGVFNAANYSFGLYNQGLMKFNMLENSTNNFRWALQADRTWTQNFANSTSTNGNSVDYFVDTGDFYPNKTGIWVGGTFTTAAGVACNRLVCLDYESGRYITGLSAANGPNGNINQIIKSGNRIYIKGVFSTFSGVSRNLMAAISFPDMRLLPFNPNGNNQIRQMSTGVDGMYLAGNFFSIGGTGGNYSSICKVDYENGVLITGFRPRLNFGDNIYGSIAEFGDKVIINLDTSSNRAWTYRISNFPGNGPLIPNYHNPISFPVVVDNISGLTTYTGLGYGFGQSNIYAGDQSSDAGFNVCKKIDDKIYIFGKNAGAFIQKVPRNNAFAVDLNTNRITNWNPNLQMINATTSAYSQGNNAQGVYCMHLDTGDNTLTLGGRFNTVNEPNNASTIRNSIAIVDIISGGLITNFRPDLGLNFDVLAIEKSGNTLFLGGNFTSGGIPNRYHHFIGLNINTNAPTHGFNLEINNTLLAMNFNKTSPASNAKVSCMKRKDNLLYVGGSFDVVSGNNRFGIFCLDIQNNTITDFNLNLDRGEVKAMDIDTSTNTLYIGGGFRSVLGQERNYGAAINLNNTGLLEWDPELSKEPTNLRVTPSGIVICGSFSNAGERRAGLAFFSIQSGNLLKRNINLMTNPFGGVYTTEIYNNILYAHGRTFTAAMPQNVGLAGGQQHGNQIRYNLVSGHIVTGFVNNRDNAPLCIRGGGNVLSTFLESGFMYMGGSFTSVQAMNPAINFNATTTRNRVAFFNLNNQTISGIDYNVNNNVWAIKRKDNFLYLGGEFTSVLGTARNRIARINLNTNTLDGWNPNSPSTVYDFQFSGDKLFVGGDFSTISGLTRNRVCRFDVSSASGGALESYNPLILNGGVRKLLISGNTLYAGGTFSQVGAFANNVYLGVAAFDTNSAAHLTAFRTLSGYSIPSTVWFGNRNVTSTDGVSALHMHPSGLFIGGDILSVGSSGDTVSPRGVFLVNPTNGNIIRSYGGAGEDSVFRSRPNFAQGDANPGQIWSIQTTGDILIAGGEFGDGTEYRHLNSASSGNYFITLKDKITGVNIGNFDFTIDSDPSSYLNDPSNNTYSSSAGMFLYDASFNPDKIFFHGQFSNMKNPNFRCSIAAMDYNGKIDKNFQGFGV